jgi:hypothetical protein
MKAWVFGGMLLLGASLAACSSSSSDGAGGSGSGGGSGEGGSGEGGSGTGSPTAQATGTGSTGTSSPTSTGTSSPTSTSTGGTGECLGEQFLNDPTCDACAQANCCDELEACVADLQAGGTDCFNADGTANPDGALFQAFETCATTNCAEECGGGATGGVCDSGIAYGDPPDAELNGCLGDACCDEYTECTQDATDVQGCIDCLQAGGTDPLCAAAAQCADASGCFGYEICEAGVSVPDQTVADCVNMNCCDAVTTCFGADGSNFDACEQCIADGGGAACDDLIACDSENACGLLTVG